MFTLNTRPPRVSPRGRGPSARARRGLGEAAPQHGERARVGARRPLTPNCIGPSLPRCAHRLRRMLFGAGRPKSSPLRARDCLSGAPDGSGTTARAMASASAEASEVRRGQLPPQRAPFAPAEASARGGPLHCPLKRSFRCTRVAGRGAPATVGGDETMQRGEGAVPAAAAPRRLPQRLVGGRLHACGGLNGIQRRVGGACGCGVGHPSMAQMSVTVSMLMRA